MEHSLARGQLTGQGAEQHSRNRSAWIDVARGIGIFLVVLAHAERGIVKANMAPPTTISLMMDETIYAFHMPLFFLLAGLHVGRGMRAGRAPFVRDKLVTIVWPYFLWSVIYIVTSMAVGVVNTPFGLSDLSDIAWQPVAHFWFLYALFLCHLMAAALWPNRWMIIAATLSLILFWVAGSFAGILTQTAQMFPFFAIGLLAGPSLGGQEDRLRGTKPLLAIGGFLLLIFIRFFLDRPPTSSWAFAPLFYMAAIGGIAGVIGLSFIIGERAGWLRRIGQASMAIFVIHTFFTAGLRIAFMQSGVKIDHLLLLALSCICAIAGPWLIYELLGRRDFNTAFGLGKYVRP